MSDARAAILGTLRRTRDAHPVTPPPSDFTPLADKQWPPEERLPRIRRMMEAVHTEFLDATEADWPAVVTDFLTREGAANLLYAPGTADGAKLANAHSPSPPGERDGVRGMRRSHGPASKNFPPPRTRTRWLPLTPTLSPGGGMSRAASPSSPMTGPSKTSNTRCSRALTPV